MRKKNSFRRRKSFLIDSNLAPRKKTKRVRNTFLNTLRKVFLFRSLTKWFQGKFFLLFLLIFMGGFIIFALLSPYFKLKSISVVRNNPNIDVEAIQESLNNFYGENTLFLPKSNMMETLKESFPEFESVVISEKWPDGIQIEVGLSPATFIMLNRSDATFFLLTNEGVLLPKNGEEEFPVIEVFQYERPFIGRHRFIEPKDVRFVEDVLDFVQTELKLNPKAVKYLWAANELHVVVHEDTELWFDMRVDLEDQTRRLLWALDEINFYSRPPKHVDLRIPSQLYWAQ